MMNPEETYAWFVQNGFNMEYPTDVPNKIKVTLKSGRAIPKDLPRDLIIKHHIPLRDRLLNRHPVRKLRDAIYGICTDANWESVKDNWCKPESEEWLKANQPK